jgi:hypothetical protein
MNVQETLMNVLQTNAAVEIINELVLSALISSRDTCIVERARLDNIAKNRKLHEHEEMDWECLVQDIHALNRVIEYYGGIK